MEKIILASQSPRRVELLNQLNIKFTQIISPADEDIITSVNYPDPKDFVTQKAIVKAQAVAVQYPDNIVIGCDTIVVLGNRIFEKPTSRGEVEEFMKIFRNNSHTVYSAVAVYQNNILHTEIDHAEVFFGDFSDEQIQKYIDTNYWTDKAGGYGIQGLSAQFIEKINGDVYSVIGLPIYKLTKILISLQVI